MLRLYKEDLFEQKLITEKYKKYCIYLAKVILKQANLHDLLKRETTMTYVTQRIKEMKNRLIGIPY